MVRIALYDTHAAFQNYGKFIANILPKKCFAVSISNDNV